MYTSRYLVPIDAPPIEDAALVVDNARIAAVGTREALLPRFAHLPQIDFGASILLPPLVNAHTHLELTDFPVWEADAPPVEANDSFVDWILRLIGIKRAQTAESIGASLQHGLAQQLRFGTGAVADILSNEELLPLYADSPLLGRVDLELIGRGIVVRPALIERAQRWAKGGAIGRLLRGLSPHAPYTVDADLLSEISDFAGRRHLPLAIHFAESAAETELLTRGTGELVDKLYALIGWPAPEPFATPLDYLTCAEALRPQTLLVHGVQLDDTAIARIARSGTSLVLCPRSNRRLGVGVAPVASLRCQGVKLALGTDSLASNNSLSLYEEMEAALEDYQPVFSAADILRIATLGGAVALNLVEEIGRLSSGCGAHFQVLRPATLPRPDDLAGFLCRGERGRDVAHLFLGGVDVLAGGK